MDRRMDGQMDGQKDALIFLYSTGYHPPIDRFPTYFKTTIARKIGRARKPLTMYCWRNILSTFRWLWLAVDIQSVHIRPWKIISQHNIASGRNMKKSKYYVWTKYFDWRQTLLGSNISSGHNLQIVLWRNIAPRLNIFHGRKWSDCIRKWCSTLSVDFTMVQPLVHWFLFHRSHFFHYPSNQLRLSLKTDLKAVLERAFSPNNLIFMDASRPRISCLTACKVVQSTLIIGHKRFIVRRFELLSRVTTVATGALYVLI